MVVGRANCSCAACPRRFSSFHANAVLLRPGVLALALALPQNTRIRRSEDMFLGALWRSRGVTLLFEPRALAVHDEQHHERKVGHVEHRAYANLFDALLANRDLRREQSQPSFTFSLQVQCATFIVRRERGITWPPGTAGIERWYVIGATCKP